GMLSGSVFGLGGGNSYDVSGGTIGGSIFAGSQDDVVVISGSALIQGTNADPDAVGLEDGNDRFEMSGGRINGAVSGGAGDDVFSISDGTITGFVSGNAGGDEISVSGGTIQGDIIAETVHLSGGTIGGDISGLSGNTLVIDDTLSPDALNLRDGVVFSGTDAVGIVNDTDLAAGGTKTQNFTGFTSVTAQNSTLGFAPGSVNQIGLLTLEAGSTLFAQGPARLTGTLSVTNSTISLIDGAADDVLTLGG